jgi:extracellular elastinolytic metalloproteinase
MVGAQVDGDFDPTVIFHENTHGMSNRLVGGGSTGCLFGLQSGGMGEGWSDSWLPRSSITPSLARTSPGIRSSASADSR